MNQVRLWAVFLLTASFSVSSIGCGKESVAEQGAGMMAVNVVSYVSQKQDISDRISMVGTLNANESVEIKSEMDGVVEEINFKEGESVQKGRVLFKIDEKKLKASLAQSQANLKLAEATTERYKALIESKAVSRQEYDEAIATLETNSATVDLMNEDLSDATITAPFDGTMGERTVSVGQFVAKGTLLSYLVNQDPMKAEFHVPERHLSRIKTGQEIEIMVAAYPDERFSGEVYFIDPKIDELTRTALIKAYVPNKEGKLREGMFANLSLIVDVRQGALVIPETALIVSGDSVSVFVIDEQKIVHVKTVKTGIRFNGFVEIISGLNNGDIVVTEGYQKIQEGSLVNPRVEEVL